VFGKCELVKIAYSELFINMHTQIAEQFLGTFSLVVDEKWDDDSYLKCL
jgi:hypothetical protein